MQRGSCEEIFDALKALKPAHRSTFLLAAVHGYDYREIAVKTGRSEEGVRQLIYRARRQLRDTVDSATSS